MQFVKVNELREGMRLARPIYNKQGVLLYERDSRLTKQGIASILNFGLIGLFILEPAEPVPPMTQADIEFERFQTMTVFAIQEEMERIRNTGKMAKLQVISGSIVKNYGHLDSPINFIQSLRSREDYIYKHALNVAILCTMITNVMNVKLDERQNTIFAALLHDIGKLSLPPEMMDMPDMTPEMKAMVHKAEVNAYDMVEKVFYEGAMVRRICQQSQKILEEMDVEEKTNMKLFTGSKILAVADTYDTMTAMKISGVPLSEVAAIKFLLERPDTFDPQVVKGLIRCINILTPGVSVELNTGEKALVIKQNELNILRPIVLSFRDNSIIDLDTKLYDDIEIVDIMKTLDNRCIIDTETLKKAGIRVDMPEFV